MVFPVAANTDYTVTSKIGVWLLNTDAVAQNYTTTNSVHPATVGIHAAGRLALEEGATVRGTTSFSIDDNAPRANRR